MAKRNQRKKKKKRAGFDAAAHNKIENWLADISYHLHDKKYDEAILVCEKVLKHRKTTRRQRSEAYAGLAAVYMQQGEFNRCYDTLTLAINIAPNLQWDLYYNRSVVDRYTKKFGHALYDIEKAAALCDDPEWIDEIAKSRETIHEIAKKSCALHTQPFTVADLMEKERVFRDGLKAMQTGKLDEAEVAFKMVISLSDNIPQARFNLGSVYGLSGNWDKAEEMWQAALKIDPDYHQAQANLNLMEQFRSGEADLTTGDWNLEPYKVEEKPEFHFIE